MIEGIFTVDRSQVHLKRAVGGLIAVLLILVFVGVTGDLTFTVAFAAVFTTASAGDGLMRERLPGMIRFVAVGSLVGGLAFLSIENAAAIAAVLGVITYLATLATAYGPSAARRGMYLTLWALFALLLGSADTSALAAGLAFAAGGTIAIGVIAIRLAFLDEDSAEDPEPITGIRLADAVRNPIGVFSMLRALAVALAVLFGFWWFTAYPLWVPITVIVIIRPSAKQTYEVAIQRTLGTALGAGFAIVVASFFPRTSPAIAVAFVAAAFGMVAFQGANYTLFATFLTAMLVFAERLAEADAFDAGLQRLGATAVGSLISFAAIAIAKVLADRHALEATERPD